MISVVITDLSEVVAATAARTRLALIVDSSDDAIVSTTLEGVVQSWNLAAEQLFGYSADEAIGQPLQTLTIPPEQADVVSSRFAAIRRGEHTERLESKQRRKDGSQVEASVIYSPILDPSGAVVGASINTRDITERRRIQKDRDWAAFLLGERLKELNCLHDISTIFAASGLSFDQRLQRVVDRIPAGFMHPEVTCARITRKSGQYRSADFKETAWRLVRAIKDEGEESGSLEVFYTDEIPTSEKEPFLQEEKALVDTIGRIIDDYLLLDQTLSQLTRFRDLLDASKDAVFVVEPGSARIVDINRQACDSLGYSRDELLRLSIMDIEAVLPSESAWDEHVREMKKAGSMLLEGEERRKDGSTFPVEVSVRYVSRDEGNYMIAIARDITERKQAEENLKLFRTLLDHSNDAIEVLEPSTLRFLDVNEAECRTLGYSREELLGMSILDVDTGLTPELVKATVEILQQEGNTHFETEHQRKDGSTFPVEVHVTMVELDKTYMLSIARDITERKEAQELLRQSEEKLRALVESTSDLIWEVDQNGAYTYVSPQVEALLGYPREEVLGKTPFDFMPAEEALRLGEMFKDYIDKRAPLLALENANLHQDGHVVILETNGVPFFDDKGEFAGYRGIDRDITERKQAEEILHDEKTFSETVVQGLPDIFFFLDTQGGMLRWNKQLEVLFGLSAKELLGTNALSFIHEDDRPRAAKSIQQVFETGSASVEARLVMAGGIRDYLLTGIRIETTLGINLIGIGVDITERKEAEEEIKLKNTILQTQQEVSPDAILIVDENAQIISYNQQFIDMWHVPSQILDTGLDDLVLKAVTDKVENPETFVTWVQYLYEHRDEKSHEEIVLKDGRIIDRYSASVTGVDGVYYGRVWYFRDITERKQAELKLHESERRFTDLLGNVELISMMLDREARITYCNDYLLRLTGWQRKEVIGKNWWDVFMPPEIQDLRNAFFTSLLDNQSAALHHENDIVTRSGERRMIRWNNSVLRSAAGEVIGTASIGEDITEQTKSEASIKYLNRVLSVLSGINTLIVRVNDREELFREACNIAVKEGGFRMTMIVIVDQSTMLPISVVSAGKDNDLLAEVKDVMSSSEGMQTTLVAQAIREKKAIIANDTQNDPRLLFGKQYSDAGVRSMTVLPLVISDEAVGTLVFYAHEIEFFQQDEMKLLTELADDIAFAMDHIDKQERINYLAYYDELTGLANRTLFLERVEQYIHSADSNGYKLALGMIDLERFKNINDSLGRSAGDSLLKQVAEWLTQFMQDANLLARIDADHFTFVVPDITTDGGLAMLVENVLAAFQEHSFDLNDATFRISIKIGIAVFPDDGDNVDTLYRNAEAALKKAKQGGDRYLFYTQKMTGAVADKLHLENQLRRAIDNEEFVLYYQPKVNLMSGKVTSAEALIRWNDPTTGLVPPGKFIPILEETGLIFEVGRWAMHQAIKDNMRWRNAGLPALRIAVNVSPLQLHSLNFIDEIKEMISIDAGAAAGLELELTESLIMQDVEHSTSSLEAIRALGITIAIDDFGTGFSSLSYLAKLPVDTLKIDRAFVIEMDKPEGLTLVTTIIVMAHALNLKVVAEGVETEHQMRQLLSLNCDEMQGFLFSKPVPADIFEAKFLDPIAPEDKQ